MTKTKTSNTSNTLTLRPAPPSTDGTYRTPTPKEKVPAVLTHVKTDDPDQPHRWVLRSSSDRIAGPQENYTDKVHALRMAIQIMGIVWVEINGKTITARHPHYAVTIRGWTPNQVRAALR